MSQFSPEEVQAYKALMEASNKYQELAARRELAEDIAEDEGRMRKPKKPLLDRLRDAALGLGDEDMWLQGESLTEYSQRVHQVSSTRWAMERDLRQQMGVPEDWRGKEAKIAFYKRQLALLEKANAAPRCERIYPDGTRCGCPRIKKGRLCYAHQRMEEVRPRKLNLLVMEDANSVILNIAMLQKALLDGEISAKDAGLLFYSTQTGAAVLPQVTFRETKAEEMVVEEIEPQRNTEGSGHRDNGSSGHLELRRKDAKEEGAGCGMEKEGPAPHEHGNGGVLQQAPTGTDKSVCATQSQLRSTEGESQEIIPGDDSDKSFSFGDDGEGGGRRKIGASGCRDIGPSQTEKGVA